MKRQHHRSIALLKNQPAHYSKTIAKLAMILKPSVAIAVAFTIGSTLLDCGVIEFQICLEWKRSTEDGVMIASRVDEFGIRVDTWRLRRVVPGEKRSCRCSPRMPQN